MTTPNDQPVERRLMPAEAAACLVTVLERRGARFHLLADGFFWCALDGSDVANHDEAQGIAQVVLALRDEIRTVLLNRRTLH